jgi:hypothetical protein
MRGLESDKAEFYATVELAVSNLDELLAEWQHYYNWEHPHSAHHGKSPMDRYFELAEYLILMTFMLTINPIKSEYKNQATNLIWRYKD